MNCRAARALGAIEDVGQARMSAHDAEMLPRRKANTLEKRGDAVRAGRGLEILGEGQERIAGLDGDASLGLGQSRLAAAVVLMVLLRGYGRVVTRGGIRVAIVGLREEERGARREPKHDATRVATKTCASAKQG